MARSTCARLVTCQLDHSCCSHFWIPALLDPASTTAIQTPAMAPSALCLPSARLEPPYSWSDCAAPGLPLKDNLRHSRNCSSLFQDSSQDLFFSFRAPLGVALATTLAEDMCSSLDVASLLSEDSAYPDQSSNGDFEHPSQEISSSGPAFSSGRHPCLDDANLLLHFTDQVYSQLVPVPDSN